jgi:23S rRNA (adenine-N6)-dimethyltransferase
MSFQRDLRHSQNFIRRPELVKELLKLTEISPNDLVVEIGPGKGVITRELLKRVGRIIAIERDSKFSEELSLLNNLGNLQLVIDDFLEWQLPQNKYKVFSNIPFNYTADIVNKLTSSDNLPTDIYLIMQEAAAHRFAGVPYNENSLISILIGVNFSVQILREIDRESFEPKPNVNVVFVHFDRYARSQIPRSLIPDDEQQLFRDFVVYGYTQWEPTVLSAFSKVFTQRQQSIIAKSQKIEGLKPTDLTIDQWIGLFKTFRKYVSENKKHRVRGSEEHLTKQKKRLHKQHRTRKHT